MPGGYIRRPRARLRCHAERRHSPSRKGGGLNKDSNLGFIHRFEAATNASAPALLLLHGAGGDENSLLALGRAIAPGGALLSPRGKVTDSGSARFLERLEEGPDSEKELSLRTEELASFVRRAAKLYGISSACLLLVGFSNGASIGVHLLMRVADQFRGAVLMRGMCPSYLVGEMPPGEAGLDGKPVLLLSGIHDPLVQSDQAEELAAWLRRAGAEVTLHWEETGHSLSQGDVLMAFDWVRPFYSYAAVARQAAGTRQQQRKERPSRVTGPK